MLKIGKIKITKMHGLGNSYAVLEDLEGKLKEKYQFLAKILSDSKYGLGTDGILVLNRGKKTKYRMRIFNPDGSEAEMCGNGARIFARYLYDNHFIKEKEFNLETYDGSIIVRPKLKIKNAGVKSIAVEIGEGKIIREEIIEIEDKKFKGKIINVGNPHFVMFFDEVSEYLCKKYGSLIENHPKFQPKRINVEFAKILNPQEIKLFVWERGAGFTLACGTGASATAFLANKEGKTKNKVKVHLPGGTLKIFLKGENITIEGPAEYIFKGEFFLNKYVVENSKSFRG